MLFSGTSELREIASSMDHIDNLDLKNRSIIGVWTFFVEDEVRRLYKNACRRPYVRPTWPEARLIGKLFCSILDTVIDAFSSNLILQSNYYIQIK